MEQLAEKRRELEEYLRLYAKPNTTKWQQFQVEASVGAEAQIAAQKREELVELTVMVVIIGAFLAAALILVFGAYPWSVVVIYVLVCFISCAQIICNITNLKVSIYGRMPNRRLRCNCNK